MREEFDHDHDDVRPRSELTIWESGNSPLGSVFDEWTFRFPKDGPAITYRFEASSGQLLYVGHSRSFGRIREHFAGRQPWAQEAGVIEIEYWCCLPAAEAREIERIHDGEPKYNVEHNLGRTSLHATGRPVLGCPLCKPFLPRRRSR